MAVIDAHERQLDLEAHAAAEAAAADRRHQ
jgi:hypothetical protein